MSIKIITDFTNEYNPVPKPLAKVKMPKAMKKEGKKTVSWAEERKKLVIKFTEMGIRECELKLVGCWRNTALGFAHLDKRRKLTEKDLGEVVLACNPCHGEVEYLPAGEMRKFLELVIAGRKPRK